MENIFKGCAPVMFPVDEMECLVVLAAQPDLLSCHPAHLILPFQHKNSFNPDDLTLSHVCVCARVRGGGHISAERMRLVSIYLAKHIELKFMNILY